MQQQTQLQTQQGKRGVSGRIHYVDGEVCAVLAVENDVLAIRDGIATGDTAQLLAALYRRVKDTLNSGIARVLKTWRIPGSGRHDPLEQALTPEGLLRARD